MEERVATRNFSELGEERLSGEIKNVEKNREEWKMKQTLKDRKRAEVKKDRVGGRAQREQAAAATKSGEGTSSRHSVHVCVTEKTK